MSLVTHSAVPAIPNRPALRQPNRFVRLVRAIVEARTRMYLAAVTDPASLPGPLTKLSAEPMSLRRGRLTKPGDA